MRHRLTLRLLVIGLALLLPLGSLMGQGSGETVTITIINTADEHGWLQPFTPFGSDAITGGAANILGWWQQEEGYVPEDMLLLSGGDSWTGPSISTWFQGEPVIEAFNLIGYDATAIGNHEFDFGRDILNERIAASDYAYLGANIRYADTGELADFVLPYIIEDVQGVPVGIIGLASLLTPQTTHPANITDLAFADYADTLREYVPQMRAEGAEIIIGLSHACVPELLDVAVEAEGLVDALFGGHCHAAQSLTSGGIPVMGSGWALRGYARLDIAYNTETDTIEGFDRKLVSVEYSGEENPVTPDAAVEAEVTRWEGEVGGVLAEEIGYTTTGFAKGGPEMTNLILDAWLAAFPDADVAISNYGGFRQDIAQGSITVGDIVGVLPFENRIVDALLTGAELQENLACCGGAVAGISYRQRGGTVEIEFLDGREFDPDGLYHVLVNDYMFAGGSDYLFGQQDPDGYDTGVQWRQPVIDWLRANPSSPDDPVENHIDNSLRAR